MLVTKQGWAVDVIERPDGRWEVVWYDNPKPDGGRYERNLCYPSKETALKVAAHVANCFGWHGLDASDADAVVLAAKSAPGTMFELVPGMFMMSTDECGEPCVVTFGDALPEG